MIIKIAKNNIINCIDLNNVWLFFNDKNRIYGSKRDI